MMRKVNVLYDPTDTIEKIGHPAFRSFKCTTLDNENIKSDKLSKCYISHNEPENIFDNRGKFIETSKKYVIFGYKLSSSMWNEDEELKHFWKTVTKETKLFEETYVVPILNGKYDVDLVEDIGKWIQKLFLALRDFFSSYEGEELQKKLNLNLDSMSKYVKPLQLLPDNVVFNSRQEHLKVYLHTCLDIAWLKLTIKHHMHVEKDKLSVFEASLSEILQGLIRVGINKFRKEINGLNSTPYPCMCFKELWFLVQRYVEIIHKQDGCKPFWHYFNKILKEELQFPEQGRSTSVDPKQRQRTQPVSAKDSFIAIWLMYHIAKLLQFKPDGEFEGRKNSRNKANFSLLEDALTRYLSANDPQWMKEVLHLVTSLQNHWLEDENIVLQKTAVLKILTDYFCKQLNSSESSNSLKEQHNYVEIVDNLVFNKQSIDSNFDAYLHMLGLYLAMHPTWWPSLKGRIIHKLYTPKFNDMSNQSVHNYFKLFFMLCWTIESNFEELCSKLQNILQSDSCHQDFFWSAQTSLLYLRVHKGHKLVLTEKFFTTLNVIVTTRDRKNMTQLITIIKNMFAIDKNFTLDTHLLFGDWVFRYMRWCSSSDSTNLLDMVDMLLTNMIKTSPGKEWCIVVDKYFSEILRYFSVNYHTVADVGPVTARLIEFRLINADNLLKCFQAYDKSCEFLYTFLSNILQNTKLNFTDKQEKQILHSWIRFSILHKDKDEVKSLCKIMKKHKNFSKFVIRISAEPVHDFIKKCGEKINSETDLTSIRKDLYEYFEEMPTWAENILKLAEESRSNLHIPTYEIAGQLFLHCSPALYSSAKENDSLLIKLSNILLLRPSVILPKASLANEHQLNETLLLEIRKHWLSFARGIIRINVPTGVEMCGLWKKMQEQFVAGMHFQNSPIFDLVKDNFPDDEAKKILKSIARHFIEHKNHRQANAVLKIFLTMTQISKKKFPLLFCCIFPGLCAQLKWKNGGEARSKAILSAIKKKENFDEIRPVARDMLVEFYKNSIAFEGAKTVYAFQYLAEIFRKELAAGLKEMEVHMLEVEAKRNQPFDDSLRKMLRDIKHIVGI